MNTTYSILNDLVGFRNVFDEAFNFFPGTVRADFPYVNLYQKGDSVEISAIVPGVKSEDLEIELVDNTLVLEGKRKTDKENRPYIRAERNFGKFKKQVKLPFRVDREKIDAKLENGIVTIKLEKSEDAKPKRIEIH